MFLLCQVCVPSLEQTITCVKDRPVRNATCRANSGCLRPKRVADLYLLCGTAPSPHIKRTASSQLDKHKQENDPLHHLYEQDPARKILKSRHSFLHSVERWQHPHSKTNPLVQPYPGNTTRALHQRQGIVTARFESSLNHLRTGTRRCKVLTQKWGFNEDGQTAYECGDEQTMKHMLICPILPKHCSHEDLERVQPRPRSCAHHWAGVV